MVFSRLQNLPWREVDGHVVILSPKNSTIHELNAVGGFLWMALDGQRTDGDLVTDIAKRFDVTEEMAAEDAALFFTEMQALGLVQAEAH